MTDVIISYTGGSKVLVRWVTCIHALFQSILIRASLCFQVVVARRDFQPLGLLELEMLWMYCDKVLDYFGDAGAPPDYSVAKFQKFCAKYKNEEISNGRTEFTNVKLPL